MNEVERLLRKESAKLHFTEEDIRPLIHRVVNLHRFSTLETLSMIQASADWDILGLPLALRLHIQASLNPTPATFSESGDGGDVKRRRVEQNLKHNSAIAPVPQLPLDDTPFATKVYDKLPDGVLQMVYAYIPKAITCKVMLEDRSFQSALAKTQELACLATRDETIDYFWRCNRFLIGTSLPPKVCGVFWKASGITFEKRDETQMNWSMRELHVFTERFLARSSKHVSSVNLADIWLHGFFPSLGLYASRNCIEELNIDNPTCLYKKDIRDLTPLTGLVSLHSLSLQAHQMDLTPISYLKNLNYLSLGSHALADVSFLSSLVRLRNLTLGIATCASLLPLADLRELESFSVCFWRAVSRTRGPPIFEPLTAQDKENCNRAFQAMPATAHFDSNEAFTFSRDKLIEFRRFRNVMNRDSLWSSMELRPSNFAK